MRKIVTIAVITLIAGGGALSWLILKNQPASAPKNSTNQSTTESDEVNSDVHNFSDSDYAKKTIVHNQQVFRLPK